MVEKVPRFFFSYARGDCDAYLKKFFMELSAAVARKGALKVEDGEVSFRDIDNVEPGKDWEAEIGASLAKCLTMVSVYSTWYFNRPYCGKEFQVFLQRQPNVEFQNGAARHSEKLIPVLWGSKKDLDRSGLPPDVAKYIELFIPKKFQEKYEEGLRLLRTDPRQRGKYVAVLEELADIILDRATVNPLPPMDRPPLFTNVTDAFAHAPSPANLNAMDSNSVLLVCLTASDLDAALKAGPGDDHFQHWRPFIGGGGDGLAFDVKMTLGRLGFKHFVEPAYDLSQGDIIARIVGDLENATKRNAVMLVFVDPWFLNLPRGREIGHAIMANRNWLGGLVIPVDANDAEAKSLNPLVEQISTQAFSETNRILYAYACGTHDDFELAMTNMVTEIQRRIATTSVVPTPFTGPGRSVPPVLQGPSGKQTNVRAL